jgi:hypothetical protein
MSENVQQVVGNLSDHGLKVMTDRGPRSVQKPVNIITNSDKIAELFDKTIDEGRQAIMIKESVMEKLCLSANIGEKIVVKGIAHQLDKDRREFKNSLWAVEASQEDGMAVEKGEPAEDGFEMRDFVDHVNGGKLDPIKVRKARKEEMEKSEMSESKRNRFGQRTNTER